MLRIDRQQLDKLERDYLGIRKQILKFDEAELPSCSRCGSDDTATVNIGIIGRTINIAGATSKVKLLPNGPMPGKCFCNACSKFFHSEKPKRQPIAKYP